MYYCPYCKSTFPDDSHAPCPELVGDTVVKVADENAQPPVRFEAVVYRSTILDLLDPPQFRVFAETPDHRQKVTFLSDHHVPSGYVIEVTVKHHD